MLRSSRLGISLTPMIDVVFLLLLFFLLTTQLQSTNALPLQAAIGGTAIGNDPLLIEIDDQILLNGNPISEPEWQDYLTSIAPRNIAIRPSKDVPVSRLVAFIDQARRTGWSEITLVESKP